jgi:hypothetical protein
MGELMGPVQPVFAAAKPLGAVGRRHVVLFRICPESKGEF